MPLDETKEKVPMPKDRLEKVPTDRLQNANAPDGGSSGGGGGGGGENGRANAKDGAREPAPAEADPLSQDEARGFDKRQAFME